MSEVSNHENRGHTPEAGAKFKLMALDDENLQPLWLEIGESVSSDSILAVEF